MIVKFILDGQVFVQRRTFQDFDDFVLRQYRLIESHVRIFLISNILRNQYTFRVDGIFVSLFIVRFVFRFVFFG